NTTSATNFTFQVSPVPSGEPSSYTVTGSGQTPAIGLAIGNNSETVTEAVPQDWTLTGAICTREGGAVTGSFDNANNRVTGTTIGTGASKTCYYDVTFGNANVPQVINRVTVTATSPAGNSQGTDTATVNFPQFPILTLAKSANPTTYNAVGQVITYTYTITNSGNTTLAGPFTVSDDKQPAVSCPTGSLALGASITCTSTRTPTAGTRHCMYH